MLRQLVLSQPLELSRASDNNYRPYQRVRIVSMPNEDADAIRELALKLCGVCAQAKNEHDLCWSQLYFGLSLAMRAVMRSCDCVECRRHILRHVRKELPSDLRDAVAYSKDKSRCGR